ncbi:hypothetical protein B0H17DRAFT_1127311 [Mycena rosella]|uniref:Uncharacterized protein n=1 Tax=Mycena rosella TaxID=1033263 RepID=A0AAD7GRK2_MYCRO|nr:hypothetical protein B0H17DRAFT_1127311 [Mycena rosella]
MPLDPQIHAAHMARKKASRQEKSFTEQNVFHNQNAVAGPSRLSMPASCNSQTFSQIINSEALTHDFPKSPRGGVPMAPPCYAVERIDGASFYNREELAPYPAVMHSPRGRRLRTSGPPTCPETLPLENLSNQLRQESPRLQSKILFGLFDLLYDSAP